MKLTSLYVIKFLSLFLLPLKTLSAWSEHALGVYLALEALPTIQKSPEVVVEELQTFLERNEKELAELLAREEEWARQNLTHYAPLPQALHFKATGNKATLLTRFTQALRIHPGLKLQPYIQADPRTNCLKYPSLPTKQTVFSDTSNLKGTFCQLKVGEKVHPIVVLATAADEPDHGLDIGLFEDNQTSHGSQYGFGKQPFGDPRLIYGSQAPFHMGFYHESFIVYAAAPFLKKTYPEYRTRLYRQLGIFALKKGHPYWGYRFLGWGLHYITDLTQPYHATVLPGVSLLKMLWINFLSILGFSSAKTNAINLVSNRHTAIEELQWRLVRNPLSQKTASPLVQAFAFTSNDSNYPPYSDNYLRDVIAREANQRASQADYLLEKILPPLYVSDPQFEYTPQAKEKLLVEATSYNPEGFIEFQNYLIVLFQSFGNHTRNYIISALSEASYL